MFEPVAFVAFDEFVDCWVGCVCNLDDERSANDCLTAGREGGCLGLR